MSSTASSAGLLGDYVTGRSTRPGISTVYLRRLLGRSEACVTGRIRVEFLSRTATTVTRVSARINTFMSHTSACVSIGLCVGIEAGVYVV